MRTHCFGVVVGESEGFGGKDGEARVLGFGWREATLITSLIYTAAVGEVAVKVWKNKFVPKKSRT